MKLDNLRALIKETLNHRLTEEYQDKFKMIGMLITNIDLRPQKEIYSDIRSIPGITVISSKEPLEFSQQDQSRFQALMTVKVDGHPWISKGGFDRSKMQEIRKEILKVEGVLSFNVNPDNITTL
jgi:hypothetical protein|tara:strand:+ start:1369 stop:1740 length:372 start_codon:yes stop_codon:yes gene_type:complete